MNVQVLVATMNQTDHSLLEKMNIASDAIIANQCDKNSIEEFVWNGHSIKYLNFKEKGVGLNRNNALMRASGDICLFADDDIEYVDNYEKIIIESFEKYKHADVLIFNIDGRPYNSNFKRVWFHNYLRYGTVRIAVRNRSIKENGIYFNQCFGGGTEHSHGEDNLFLNACLKSNLKIYSVPTSIGKLNNNRESTWRREYSKTYFIDQLFLYKAISNRFWILLYLQDILRHQSLYKLPMNKLISYMFSFIFNKDDQ